MLNDDATHASHGVAMEYGIPQTSTRIDMVLPGHRRPWAIEIKRGLAPKQEFENA